MRRLVVSCLVALMAVPLPMPGQVGRRRGGYQSGIPSEDVPAVTFQGTVRSLTKGEITIEVTDASDQNLTIRIIHKTRFFKDGKEIKRGDIPRGTLVAVDAMRDPDQKFSALNVVVNPPKPKPANP